MMSIPCAALLCSSSWIELVTQRTHIEQAQPEQTAERGQLKAEAGEAQTAGKLAMQGRPSHLAMAGVAQCRMHRLVDLCDRSHSCCAWLLRRSRRGAESRLGNAAVDLTKVTQTGCTMLVTSPISKLGPVRPLSRPTNRLRAAWPPASPAARIGCGRSPQLNSSGRRRGFLVAAAAGGNGGSDPGSPPKPDRRQAQSRMKLQVFGMLLVR